MFYERLLLSIRKSNSNHFMYLFYVKCGFSKAITFTVYKVWCHLYKFTKFNYFCTHFVLIYATRIARCIVFGFGKFHFLNTVILYYFQCGWRYKNYALLFLCWSLNFTDAHFLSVNIAKIERVQTWF